MSTIDERWNIVDTTRAFCQKVLPLVYDESLSYMEMVCKLSSKLNEVIENNNNLPQYVKDLIKETVHSDDFTQIVGSVLMDTIINVKFPPEGITPAKGDGVTDDTSSIQACLDYANNQEGAVVFFPSGKYLTGTLSINEETSILGADRYNTSVVLKGGGNTPLLQGAINQSIRNICLDGNRLNQVKENYLIDGTIGMALFDNVILCDSAHCITAEACYNTEFCNVMCKDIGDGVFITAAGNNNLLTNINTEYAINLTGDNNNWQSVNQTKIDSVQPLYYQTPQKLNNYFDFITMQNGEKIYNVLVEGENVSAISGMSCINVKTPFVTSITPAKGDGVTDDTLSIQSCIDYAYNNNINVCIPDGTYMVSGLKVHTETIIIGESQKAVLKGNSNTSAPIVGSEENEFSDYVQLFNLTIDGNNSAGNGIDLYGNGHTLYNVEVRNCGGHGVYLHKTHDHVTLLHAGICSLINLRIHNNGKHGLFIDSMPDASIASSLFVNNSRSATGVYNGINLVNSATKINNCHSWNGHSLTIPTRQGYAINIESNACNISNCHFEGGLNGCVNIKGRDNTFASCFIYASFSTYNVMINGIYNIFTSCVFGGWDSTTSPENFACIKFYKENGYYNVGNIIMGCESYATMVDFSGSTFGNVFEFTGAAPSEGPAYLGTPAPSDIVVYQGNFAKTGMNKQFYAPQFSEGCISAYKWTNVTENNASFVPSFLTAFYPPVTMSSMQDVENGAMFILINKANTDITINAPTGKTIDGSATFTLKSGKVIIFIAGEYGSYMTTQFGTANV